MKKVSNWLIAKLIKSMGLLHYYSIINYALGILIGNTGTLLASLLAVWICFGSVKNAIFFAIAFSILRPFTGGIHMDTQFKCVLTTIYIFVISVWLAKSMFPNILMSIALISSIGIWIFSPVIGQDKILTIEQEQKNRWITHRIVVFYWITIGCFGNAEISRIIQVVFVIIFILQLLKIFLSKNFIEHRCSFEFLKISKTLRISTMFLAVCMVICKNAVHRVSAQWCYQDDIPDDIQRKFDNM